MNEHSRGYTRTGLLGLVLSVVFFAAAGWLFFNRQYVLDKVAVASYQPTEEIRSIVRAVDMSKEGEFYFYASRPAVQDRDEFNVSCRSVQSEKTAVLGCYDTQRQIYVFDVNNPQLEGIVEVTAAHEMLHAVYDRLSDEERAHVDGLIDEQARHITDPDLQELLAEYAKTEPTERLNELHSIIGTQYKSLSPELEDYYARYFDDRAKVVALYDDYHQVFEKLETRQEYLVSQLESLAGRINGLIPTYNQNAADFTRDVNSYNRRQYTTQAEADADRQALLARQRNLESQRSQIIRLQDQYESYRRELVELNLRSAELNQSVNSTIAPLKEVQ